MLCRHLSVRTLILCVSAAASGTMASRTSSRTPRHVGAGLPSSCSALNGLQLGYCFQEVLEASPGVFSINSMKAKALRSFALLLFSASYMVQAVVVTNLAVRCMLRQPAEKGRAFSHWFEFQASLVHGFIAGLIASFMVRVCQASTLWRLPPMKPSASEEQVRIAGFEQRYMDGMVFFMDSCLGCPGLRS